MNEKELRKIVAKSLNEMMDNDNSVFGGFQSPGGYEEYDITGAWGGISSVDSDEKMLSQQFSDEDGYDAVTSARDAAEEDILSDPDIKQWEHSEDVDLQEPAPGEMNDFLRRMRKVSR